MNAEYHKIADAIDKALYEQKNKRNSEWIAGKIGVDEQRVIEILVCDQRFDFIKSGDYKFWDLTYRFADKEGEKERGWESDDPEPMSEEDELESKLNDNYLLGQSAGMDEVASRLLQKSKELFGKGRDEEAKLLRELSKEIQEMADKRYTHPEI